MAAKARHVVGALLLAGATAACSWNVSKPVEAPVRIEVPQRAYSEAAVAAAPRATVIDVLPREWPVLPGPSDTSGFDPVGLSALTEGMRAFVTDGRVPGMATLLVKGGEVVHYQQAGVRRLSDQAPIEEDTLYRIYSMTKPITGVAMMMLWEEGKFSLDDPVTKYVPEFENLRVLIGENEDGTPIVGPVDRAPTIRELMTHTAGFAYGLGGVDYANRAFRDRNVLRAPDFETMIAQVADIPLLSQPGEQWYYSVAVDIQGYVVEKLSGQSFGEFLETRLFDPLGMTDTGFVVSATDYNRFGEVAGYHPETGALVPIPYDWLKFTEETVGFESGGGGLVSTMRDYARFLQMLLNEGELSGQRILKPSTVKMMQTNLLGPGLGLAADGTNAAEPNGLGFGLDLGVVVDPVAANQPVGAGSFFWGGAAGTWFWADPENDLFFIGMVQIFTQGGEGVDLRTPSVELVYQALEQ